MTDSVLTYLDTYCERAGDAGVLGEPLNLLTNLCFIAAALLCADALRRHNPPGRCLDICLLCILLFAIGIGSGLWHLHPSGITVLLDVIPITLFINVYIIAALRRLFLLSWAATARWWVVYLGASLLAQRFLPPDLWNGTVMYLPTYAALLVMTVLLRRRDVGVGRDFAIAFGVWTASLVFRTIDMQACGGFHYGTHFLWHALNAWVLWKLTMVLVRRG